MSAASELRRISRGLKSLPRQIVEDAAKNTVTKSVNRLLAAHTGGDRSLSRAPGRLKVDVKYTDLGTVVTAEVAPGPKRGMARWSWLEDGTQPHAIGSGVHPGTDGKGTWTKAVDPAVRQVIRDAGVRFVKVVG